MKIKLNRIIIIKILLFAFCHSVNSQDIDARVNDIIIKDILTIDASCNCLFLYSDDEGSIEKLQLKDISFNKIEVLYNQYNLITIEVKIAGVLRKPNFFKDHLVFQVIYDKKEDVIYKFNGFKDSQALIWYNTTLLKGYGFKELKDAFINANIYDKREIKSLFKQLKEMISYCENSHFNSSVLSRLYGVGKNTKSFLFPIDNSQSGW